MTGICGWFGPAPTERASAATLGKMAAGLLAPGDAHYVTLQTSAACIRGTPGGVASAAGLVAIIEGRPRWSTPQLAALAAEKGDGHALLAAYRARRHEITDAVNGPFAFAIADEAEQTLLLCVDRMGIRPLCYTQLDDGTVIFGSTTDALVAREDVSQDISGQSIFDYVYFHVVPSPATIYRDIRKLEPGELIRVRDGRLVTGRYWKPTFQTGRGDADIAELSAALMETMRGAISRCGPDTATAGFLSGGLDSSTVCGIANEFIDGPARAYSIGFEQQGYDEIEYARIAARHFGLDLREYYVTPDDVADSMDVIATAYDEPFGNSSAIPALFCARRARREGVTHLLAGDGGDELFAGNERYVRQQIFEHYRRIPGILRTGLLEPLVETIPTGWSTLTHKIARYVEQARVPMPERLQTYNLVHMRGPAELFDPGFLNTIDADHPVREMQRWYEGAPDAGLVDRMLFFDWKLTLADNDLRKVNEMCAVAGIDVDYPLLDDELVAFSTRVPGSLKLQGNRLRYFFRQAVADFLPGEILQKTKHGFGLPFGEWLRLSTPPRRKSRRGTARPANPADFSRGLYRRSDRQPPDPACRVFRQHHLGTRHAGKLAQASRTDRPGALSPADHPDRRRKRRPLLIWK